ncbi:MAG: hypothetical protein ACOY5V_06190 [Pseudomonadota bacterium]
MRRRAEPDDRQIESAVNVAIVELMRRDRYLLEVDANERSISHRFAIYLEHHFPGYDVDCEYNRDGVDPKEVVLFDTQPTAEDTDAKTVFPDIIVHKRGERSNNLLVVEIKKVGNPQPRDRDLGKLRAYRQQLGYRRALFLELSGGAEPGVSCLKWIRD